MVVWPLVIFLLQLLHINTEQSLTAECKVWSQTEIGKRILQFLLKNINDRVGIQVAHESRWNHHNGGTRCFWVVDLHASAEYDWRCTRELAPTYIHIIIGSYLWEKWTQIANVLREVCLEELSNLDELQHLGTNTQQPVQRSTKEQFSKPHKND